MKRFWSLLVVAAFIVMTVTPALAAGSKFTLVGEITALDPTAQTLTVKVLQGNTVTQPYKGLTVVLKITPATRLLTNDGVTTTFITFNDLKLGDKISALGQVDAQWVATRVTVDLKACRK